MNIESTFMASGGCTERRDWIKRLANIGCSRLAHLNEDIRGMHAVARDAGAQFLIGEDAPQCLLRSISVERNLPVVRLHLLMKATVEGTMRDGFLHTPGERVWVLHQTVNN